jgi:two-component system phosphate regulon sensor histidine kinase PhoR
LDRDKTFQIFSNLLSNAIRYTEKGGVMIRAETIKKFTVVIFSDTGVGIEPQNISRIFNRFFRTDFARNRVSGGAGLGLAITRAIVEAHAGKIEVKSQIGQGTTFTLTFPNLR